jgi:hypothetical protein
MAGHGRPASAAVSVPLISILSVFLRCVCRGIILRVAGRRIDVAITILELFTAAGTN